MRQALSLALTELRLRPWSHDSAVLAGRCFSETARPHEAEAYYRRAEWTAPLSLSERHTRAAAWLRANDVPKAVSAYQDVLGVAPKDRVALRILATLEYSVQHFARARVYAEGLTELPGSGVTGFALLGSIAHDSSNPNEAVTAYQNVLRLDPQLTALPFSVIQFWRELSQDLIATGRPDEARKGLVTALTKRDDAELHFLRGKAEEALGDNDAAEAACLRAVERDPALGPAWLLLGQIALRRGKPQDAVADLQRANKLMRETYQSVYALSQAYRQLGDGENALRLARRAEALRSRAFRGPGVAAP